MQHAPTVRCFCLLISLPSGTNLTGQCSNTKHSSSMLSSKWGIKSVLNAHLTLYYLNSVQELGKTY